MTRLLVDANLSPALAEALCRQGHDAVHVNQLGLRTAPDSEIFRRAAELGAAVVTQDDDYLRMLRNGARGPSVIHLSQREVQRDPVVGGLAQAMRLSVVLHELGPRVEQGLAVRVGAHGMRVDPLPLRARQRSVSRPGRDAGAVARERARDAGGREKRLPGRDR